MELNQVVNRPLLGHHYHHITKTTVHDREKFEFHWTSGVTTIDFFIFTDTNFLNWSQGQPFTPQIAIEEVTTDALIFDTSGPNRTWVFVWYNFHLSSAQLDVTWDRFQWIDSSNIQILSFPWAAILFGTMCVMIIVILVRKRTR